MNIKKIITLVFCFTLVFVLSCSDIQQPDDFAVEKAYKSAEEAKILWFEIDNMAYDSDIFQEIDGIRYYKVTHSMIETIADLRDYLETLFIDSIVDGLLERNRYKDIDGQLYVVAASGSTNPAKGEEKYEIIRVNERKIIYRVTVEDINLEDFTVIDYTSTDMVYEYIEDKWVFSKLDRVR